METYFLRSRDDPESRWHCCDLWQRRLSSKWNAREFAVRHGCRVPQLYWSGRRIAGLPLEALPEHFVVRPSWGQAGVGTHVMAGDYDMLHDCDLPRRRLIAEITREAGWLARHPYLVEEFVRTEAGEHRLPTEYKCYTFGAAIAAVQVVHRDGGNARHRFYTPDWEPFDDVFNTYNAFDEVSEPPRCLSDILAAAKRLGCAYGAFVRVDVYATDKGCVFGEFASVPLEGKGFTEFSDRYLGEMWEAAFPGGT